MNSSSGGDSSSPPRQWKFSQVFGEPAPGENLQDADVVSAIEFDKTGDYLAVGDHGGRVVIFGRKGGKYSLSRSHSRNELERLDFTFSGHPEYFYKTEFQSHEPEFDYLKSLEIDEKINRVSWCATYHGPMFILSTNDKTIKLWKVKEQKVKKVKEMNPNSVVHSENALLGEGSFVSEQEKPSIANGHRLGWTEDIVKNMTQIQDMNTKIAYPEDTACASCRRVYGHAHDFSINSISNNRRSSSKLMEP